MRTTLETRMHSNRVNKSRTRNSELSVRQGGTSWKKFTLIVQNKSNFEILRGLGCTLVLSVLFRERLKSQIASEQEKIVAENLRLQEIEE
jgi:hypothetical protein